MRIESGYSLSPREERVEFRSKRVQDFISLYTRSPQSISQGLVDILRPRSVTQKINGGGGRLSPLDIEVMEDAALGISYCLQANLMHRSMAPVPRGLHHMVDSFVPKERQTDFPELTKKFTFDQKQDLILERLGIASNLPKSVKQQMGEYIYFSDPQESAVFAIADTLVHGVITDKKGRRVVFMEQKTEEWNEAEKLVRRVNKYLDERNHLVMFPLPKDVRTLSFPRQTVKKEVNTLVRVPKKEMEAYRNIKDILYMAQEYTDAQIYNGEEVDVQFMLPQNILTSVIQRGEMSKGNVVRELISVSDPESDLGRKTTLNTLFGAKDQEKTLHSLGLYSYLTLARPESGEKVAAWLTQTKRGEIHTVADDALLFFTELFKDEHFHEISDALTNDLLQENSSLPALTKLLTEQYARIRHVSQKHITRELANLPIVEMGAKLFIGRQISTLRDEISDAIKGRRSVLRSSHQAPAGSEMNEEILRQDGFPLLQNEQHLPIEINVVSGDPRDQETLAHLLTHNIHTQQDVIKHLKEHSQERMLDLLIYMGVELWSQTADNSSDFGARSLNYTEERVGKGNLPQRTYDIPESLASEYTGSFFLNPHSKTGLWIPITQQVDLENDDSFRMGYGDMIIGRVAGKKVTRHENL